MCQSLELDQSVQQKFHRTREELSSALVERDQEVDLLLTSLSAATVSLAPLRIRNDKKK